MPRSIPWMAPNGAKQGQVQSQDQGKASNPSKRKRSSDVIDLTDDGAGAKSTPKTPRTGHDKSFSRTPSQSQSHTSAGPTSAARSRQFARTPSWTQPSPSSQGPRTSSNYVPPWTPPTSSRQHSQAERDAWLQEEGNDIFENVASSQNIPGLEQYQKYGQLDTKIVGVRFYTGE